MAGPGESRDGQVRQDKPTMAAVQDRQGMPGGIWPRRRWWERVKDARAEGQRADRRRSELPDFLTLPPASAKPRPARLTHVLDKGIAPGDLRVLLARFAEHVDIWKMGWGTAYLDPDLCEKLAILDQHGVRACTGGTLLEAAWLQGWASECLAWVR